MARTYAEQGRVVECKALMYYWVTSDLHFGHANIIGYCNRPFKNVTEMDYELARRFNERVSPDDTTFILGDVAFRSSGGTLARRYLDSLNGSKVIVQGNHDNNNSVKTIIQNMVITFGGYRIGLIHAPEDFLESVTCNQIDFNLHGHSHNNGHKWQWRGRMLQHLLISTCVEQWGYYPVRLDEIIKLYEKIKREQYDEQTKRPNVYAEFQPIKTESLNDMIVKSKERHNEL